MKIQMTSAVVRHRRSLRVPIKPSLCLQTAAKRSRGETDCALPPFVSCDMKCVYLDDNFCLQRRLVQKQPFCAVVIYFAFLRDLIYAKSKQRYAAISLHSRCVIGGDWVARAQIFIRNSAPRVKRSPSFIHGWNCLYIQDFHISIPCVLCMSMDLPPQCLNVSGEVCCYGPVALTASEASNVALSSHLFYFITRIMLRNGCTPAIFISGCFCFSKNDETFSVRTCYASTRTQ